jgi:hypothetical protein
LLDYEGVKEQICIPIIKRAREGGDIRVYMNLVQFYEEFFFYFHGHGLIHWCSILFC